VAILYIIQHLLSVLILFKLKKLYAFISLFFFIIIFTFKPDTFDMYMYPSIVDQTHNYEFLFGKLLDFLSLLIKDNRQVILAYQIFMLILSSLILLFFLDSENKILILAIIFSSVAMMLGVNNNLRQGTASILILLGMLSYIFGYKKTGFFFILSSQGFHESAIFFVIVVILSSFIYLNLYKLLILNTKFTNMLPFYLLAILLAFATVFMLSSSIYILDLITLETSRFKNYYRFFQYSDFRTSLMNKTLLILLLIVITEFILKFRLINYKLDLFRFLRIYFLLFCLFLSFVSNFSEIGNRILYFYYVIEIGVLCFLVSQKYFNTLTVNLLAYAFAFNVINILGGI
jgi:hypothetical protein